MPTPVWFGLNDGKAYIRTEADVAKVKRIANDPRVCLAPCTVRGRPLGPTAEGRARLLEHAGSDERVAEVALKANYGLGRKIYERVAGPARPRSCTSRSRPRDLEQLRHSAAASRLRRLDSSYAADPVARTWFITGTSRGFGREWASAALARGDRVVGTARDPRALDDLAREHPDTLLALALDVTDRAAVFEVVERANAHFGELDIVVNNAGYGQFGMIEELSEREMRDQIETNLLGALWVTQAALPFLRSRANGHIVQVSSIGGIIAFPGIGAYHASKWALEGFSQALAQEVRDFGIHVTLVEPGGFATDWGGASARRAAPHEAYRALHEARDIQRGGMNRGDPHASAQALLAVVDADPPPPRVFFGITPLGLAEREYEARLENWRRWQPVAELAQGDVAVA